jgi:co-chaperonin GroES (HSP10)
MNFQRIIGDRVLLSPLPPQEKTLTGLFLPQAQQGDVMYYWRVDQVGEGKRGKDGELVPPAFAVGELVITPLHFTHTTIEDGTNRKLVDCEQIVGKFVDELDAPALTVLPDPV